MVVPRHYSMDMEASTSLCRRRSARLASSSCSTWVECTPSLTSEAEGECVCVCARGMHYYMNQGVQGKCVTNKATPTRTDTLFLKEKGAALGGTRTHDTAFQAERSSY